ncbi:hypothetical protein C7974DRAFT_432520 [Boeremia exigua]|uniref:uncharacterized protein n=1 Tax=Boeremia exigua TaxID=749465 RepID=UPI001E8D910F|nr:uncharacterized protein C7974DRAFT_432520 [Boeremia exigua]KAH6637640.1 hypothetical protein C7974DRAFT_432520 [Boeremia exigua]
MARSHDSNGQPREGFFNLTRRMESKEEDQFGVDLTVFDFLLYKATATVFEWQTRPDKYESDLPNALIAMTAEWRSFLSQKNKGRNLSGVTAFRSRLLQLVLLFTHRYHPSQTWTSEESLRKLKAQNIARGTLWSTLYDSGNEHRDSGRTLNHGSLESVRQRRAADLDLPSAFDMDSFNGPDRPALDQLLPIFIELTAARTCLGDEWQPTSDWFDLAGQFMLQAVIDQYFTNGSCQTETLVAIFAFGNPGDEGDSEGPDIAAMRRLFCRDGNQSEELPEWTAVRRRYIKKSRTAHDFPKVESEHPYVKFEDSLLSFLRHLHDSAMKPDLVQVEERRISINGNELSEEQSREMIERMRL